MQVQQALGFWSEIMLVCMYVCIYVCMYVHTCICICTYVHTYVCVPVTGFWLKYANFTLVCVSHSMCTLCDQDNDKDKGHLLRQLT